VDPQLITAGTVTEHETFHVLGDIFVVIHSAELPGDEPYAVTHVDVIERGHLLLLSSLSDALLDSLNDLVDSG
jgi:hypothetical protein